MAKRKEVQWGEFNEKLEAPAKDLTSQPTTVKQWLQWLSGELAACMSQGVYVGVTITSLGDMAVTLVNDGNREKLYLEASEGIGAQAEQLREALGNATRRTGRRNR